MTLYYIIIMFIELCLFSVVKWKLNRNPETIHHLFIKKHEVGINELSKDKPPGRTVLCHNVPSYFNEVCKK